MECQAIIKNAQDILNGRLKIFGHDLDITQAIPWHEDFLSKHHWDTNRFYQDIGIEYDQGHDIKVPWELGRLQHLVTLGQAYWLTQDIRYAQCIVRHINDWIAKNPVGFGIHWINPMEVAIRSINCLLAWECLQKGPHASMQPDEEQQRRWYRCMVDHGRFIADHLEYSPRFTSNHYIINLVGLISLGSALKDWPDAQHWKDLGYKQLFKEIKRQNFTDGFHGEASTCYHALVLEAYLLAMYVATRHHVELPEDFKQAVHKMSKVLAALLRPDGSIPQIGDNDSGVLVLWNIQPSTQRAYMLDWAKRILDTSDLQIDDNSSHAFEDSGTYVLQNLLSHMVFRRGDSGLLGFGQHAHNDMLSIDLSVDGQAFIVDPGSGAYTPDLIQRNRFRSLAYHSSVLVDGQEPNPLPPDPFRLYDQAKPEVLRWESSIDADKLVACHYGYERLASPVKHTRTILHEKIKNTYLIEDEISGRGQHSIEQRFHLAPGLNVEMKDDYIVLSAPHKQVGLRIVPLSQNYQIHWQDAEYSPGYAQTQPSKILIFKKQGMSSLHLKTQLIPCKK